MNANEIGKKIYTVRKDRQLTLQDIANEIGVAKSTVQRYEKGEIANIKLPVIYAIAQVLNVNPSWLIGKSKDKEPINTSKSFGIKTAAELLSLVDTESALESYKMLEPSVDVEKELSELLNKYMKLNRVGKEFVTDALNTALKIYPVEQQKDNE